MPFRNSPASFTRPRTQTPSIAIPSPWVPLRRRPGRPKPPPTGSPGSRGRTPPYPYLRRCQVLRGERRGYVPVPRRPLSGQGTATAPSPSRVVTASRLEGASVAGGPVTSFTHKEHFVISSRCKIQIVEGGGMGCVTEVGTARRVSEEKPRWAETRGDTTAGSSQRNRKKYSVKNQFVVEL